MLKKIALIFLLIFAANSLGALTEKQIKIKKIALNGTKVIVGIGTLLPAGMVLDGFKDFYREIFTNAKIVNGLFFTSGVLAVTAGIWCIVDGVMGIYITFKEEIEPPNIENNSL